MTRSITLAKRENTDAEALRAASIIPGVVYGPTMEPVSVQIAYNEFAALYDEAGESTLLDITTPDGNTMKGLIQDVQYDPVKGTIRHVDFRQIDMNKEMTAAVELTLIGDAPAVKALGGTLMKGPSSVNIKCLPQNLVSDIEVDLSVLETFDHVIQIKDLKVPEGIEITDNMDTVVAKVSAPLTEEQLKAMEETEEKSVEDVEVEEKGKAEEEGAEAKEEPKEEKKEE